MLRSFLLLVGLPTLIAAIYYTFFASDIYISETRYAIRAGDDSPAAGLLSSVLGGSAGSSTSNDTVIVRDYILSRDMLRGLQVQLDLYAHYSSSAVDWLARMPSDATEEDFLDYYRDMVDITIDTTSNVTTLRVRAFDAAMAQRIATKLIELSEQLVNRLSERITSDTLSFARREADEAEGRVRDASDAVTQFRNETRSVDPSQETSAVLGIVTQLESQLASARAELAEAQAFMRTDSARVRSLATRVDALERQVKLERSRLAGQAGTELARLIDDYSPLVLSQKLAEQRYSSALTSLEVARAEAQRKLRYLIPFVSPELPEEALEPERVKKVLTVLLLATLIYGIGGLVLAAIYDHMGV
ncbi:MAG: hypothetical protein H6983_19155 [Ectothiorhodospiraceae bacterium]|nr:hypothetical protein [Ectothiorhodospiraceae bacterium]